MEINDLRIGLCKHTNKPVVQQRYDGHDDGLNEKGWICLHEETEEEELENIINVKKQLENGKSNY